MKGSLVGVAIVLAAGLAAAQTSRPSDADQVKARQRISMMEGMLERAVLNGADNLLRQVRSVMPDGAMLAGPAQVRGFRLDGYGVFFDVGVPPLRLSVTWPLRSMIINDSRAANAALEELKSIMVRLDPREQAQIAPLVRRIEMTLVGPSPAVGARSLRAASAAPQPAQPPPADPVDPDVIDDPYDVYTREVKTALLEAMLENSNALAIADDEWLTVAARDNVPRDPLVPGDTVDFSTVIFRVKGSDLAALHSRKLTLDEARKRVEVREY